MKREIIPVVAKMIDRLREAVQMSGLTHGDIAERVGVAKSSISDILAHRYEPRVSTFLRCCNALFIKLDTAMADLFHGDGEAVLRNASLIGIEKSDWKWLQHDIADLHFWTCLARDNPAIYLEPARAAALDRIRDNKNTYALFHVP